MLYERIYTHLSGLGDVWVAASQGDFEIADRLGREFSDELQLVLEGLGWGHGRDEAVELSAPPEVIRRAIERLRTESEGQRQSEADEWAQVRRMEEQHRLMAEACDSVLAELGDESPTSPPR